MTEIIKVSYTGRVKGGDVFDTTDEKVAKEHNIHSPAMVYGPVPIILGEGQVLKGLEEGLSSMKEGESKTIEMPPEKAFGERDNRLVKLLPIKVFKDSGIRPVPGMSVDLQNGMKARIRSVSGGRVQIDMNHELAGKALEYDAKIEGKAKDDNERMQFICEMVFPKNAIKSEKKDKEITVSLPKDVLHLKDLPIRKDTLTALLKGNLKAETIKIVEER